eukprot:7556598-Pyramimonas_sp.AAC.3
MSPPTDPSSRKCRCPPTAPRTSAEVAASCASSSWRRPGWQRRTPGTGDSGWAPGGPCRCSPRGRAGPAA